MTCLLADALSNSLSNVNRQPSLTAYRTDLKRQTLLNLKVSELKWFNNSESCFCANENNSSISI